jgi:acetyl esterase/lipase
VPIRLFLANQLIRHQMRRRFTRAGSIEPLRRMMKAMAKDVRTPPPSITVEAVTLGAVPAERLATRDASSSAAVLYLHGGAFIAGSPANHRALTWRLADGTRAPVFAVDYRLAPEHPFPAGLDDCVAAYRALHDRGFTRIAIAGDSAGGNLTLTTALELRRLGHAMPVALACLSPVTTLAEHLPSATENADRDAMFPPGLNDSVAERYVPSGDRADPRVSPLHAEDVSGMPPTIFQCSENEVLRDHSVRMAARMREAGVETVLEIEPGAFHVWQLAADTIPESKRAVDRLVAFVRPRLG